MSYILEALKKVEQKREQQQAQPFLGFGNSPAAGQGKRRWWPYVLIGVLALNAGIMAWWIGLWRDDDTIPAAGREASAPVPSAPAAANTLPPVVAVPAPARHEPVRVDEEQRQTHRAGPGRQAQAAGNSTNPIARQDAPQAVLPEPAKVPAENVPPKEMSPVPERKPPRDRVFALSELPAVIKSALPQFRISGHAYTPEPQHRVVRINEKILQEGQDLSPGMKIEEIIPGGVIMTYQGYRFRVPVVNR
jgi:general secretion pathway protein B